LGFGRIFAGLNPGRMIWNQKNKVEPDADRAVMQNMPPDIKFLLVVDTVSAKT
jgi:hypothetical protein